MYLTKAFDELSGRTSRLGGSIRAAALIVTALGLMLAGHGDRTVSADHIVPPPTQQQTFDFTFSTSGQSMWGPGAEASPGVLNFELLSPSASAWDGTVDDEDIFTVPLVDGDFGLGLHGSTSGRIGLDAEFEVGGGTVDVDAPMSVTLDIPETDSFQAGDLISIGSGTPWIRSTGASIATQPPWMSMAITADVEVESTGSAEICVWDCFDVPFFDDIDLDAERELIGIDRYGNLSVAEVAAGSFDPGNVTIGLPVAFITGVSGDLGIPDPTIVTNVVDGKIVGSGSHDDYIDVALDADTWLTRFAGGPPWGLFIPDFGQSVYGGYELLDVDVELDVSHGQTFTFTPGDVNITLQFPVSVTWWVYDGETQVDSGESTSITYTAGQRVDLIAPEGEIDITPSFELAGNTFGNDTVSTFETSIGLTALELELHWPGVKVIDPVWLYWEWHSDWECHATTTCVLEPWELHDHGSGEDHYSDAVYTSKVDLHEGPVYADSHTVNTTVDTSLFDGDVAPWTLQGFGSIGGTPFQLNPQQIPVADISGPVATTEGTLVTFDGSGSFDPDGSPITYDWDFGDGTFSSIGPIVDHIYADDGDYTVSLTVEDGHGPSPAAELDIAVANAPPTVLVRSNLTTDEGSVVSLVTTTFNDPGSLDTHTAMIDWGDGSSAVAGAVTESPTGPPGSTSGVSGTVNGSYVYADNGVYTVEVTITDDESASVSESFTVTVNNVTPTIDVGSDQFVDEGDVVSLAPSSFNDLGTLDTHTATISWGDGTATESGLVGESPFGPPGSESGADGTISGSHVYADEGKYEVSVTVTDIDGAWVLDTFDVTVENVEPTVDAGVDVTVSEGDEIVLGPAQFNDPGTIDTHTATIDWGDLTAVDVGVVTESPSGPPGLAAGLDGTVAGAHTYADNGVYVVTVQVTDIDGATGEDTLTVTVGNVDPSLTPTGESEVIIFDPFTINSAFSDPGFDCALCLTSENFTATIDWDDGTPGYSGVVSHVSGGPGTPTTGTIGAVHYYDWIGEYHVVVTVTDDDGGTDSFTHVVEVLGGHELNVEARRILSPFEGVSKEFDKALKELDDVIDGDDWEGGKLWIDEVHLQSKHGHKVFSDQKKTVGKLAKILKDDARGKGKKYIPLSPEAIDAISEAIYLILVSDQVLAQVAIEEAEATPVLNPKKQKSYDKELDKANEELLKAQAEIDKGHWGHAVDRYRKAWEHALKAIKHAQPPKL